MSFFEFPYTRTYSSDLGWLIRHVKWLTDEIENKTIKYADPINWIITHQYETNTVVIDGTTAYLSKQPVPPGVDIHNTDYWLPIADFTEVITTMSDLRQQISVNEEENYTATRHYDANDWVFIRDSDHYLLYCTTTEININGGMVPDYNIKKYTVEDLVKLYIDNLHTYVDTTIGDLDDLTTSDKTSVVNSINSLKTHSDDEDTTILNMIGDMSDLNTPSTANLCRAISTGYSRNQAEIGNLSNLNTTNKTSLVNAVNEVLADIHNPIYYNVKDYGAVGNGTTDDTTAVLRAVNDANTNGKGIVFFPAGRYKLTQTINITSDAIGLMGEGNHATYLYCYHTGACVKAQRTDTTQAVHGFLMMNIGVINRGGGTTNSGIECWYHVNSVLFNVLVSNFFIGIKLERFGNGSIYSTGIVSDVLNARGFTVNDDSVSTVIENCYVGFSGDAVSTGYGLTGTRGRVADLTIRYFDVGNGYVGILLDGQDYAPMAEPTDIRLYDIVVDSCRYCAIMLTNFTRSGGVLIDGGWINPTIINGNGLIRLDHASNVTITGMHFQQLATTQAPVLYGIIANNSTALQVHGNRFTNMECCAAITSCTQFIFNDNIIITPDAANTPISGYDLAVTGTPDAIYMGNLSNTKSYGFITKSTSNRSLIIGNVSRNKTQSFVNGIDTGDIMDNNISNL